VTTDRRLVLLSQRLGAVTDEERRIEAAGWDVRSEPCWSLDEIAVNGADADIIIAGAVEPFDASALEQLPNLRALVRRGVGHDNVDVEAASRLGIIVANVPDASVEEVSDHALALLLAIERAIPPLDVAVHDGRWLHDPRQIDAIRAGSRRLAELTLGIIGFGRIGQALARKARPLYRTLLVADPIVAPETAAEARARLVGVDELLGASDHVSLHAPLIDATRNLINASALARMRPGAVLVNTSRGGLVDEAAVIDAVRSGALAGAGLDVTAHEPLPADDPLLTTPGILLTAHSAASSTTAKSELARRSIDAVVALIEGRLPDSVVNPDVLGSTALRHRAVANRR
jgi:D-3-phosphoglycerate dehydrogenase